MKNPPAKTGGLGRGLSALIPEAKARPRGLQHIPLADIDPNPHQPRKQFDEAAIRELADSIGRQGLLAPLIVRAKGARFELIAGERRFRALKLLARPDALAFVREADDMQSLEVAITENIQREQFNALETAYGFQLMAEQGLTHHDIATRVGKSRAAVSNQLRLLKLPEAVRQALLAGQLEMGHARALLAVEDETKLADFARRVIDGNLTVRQTEQMIAAGLPAAAGAKKEKRAKKVDANIRALEERFSRELQTAVAIRGGTRGGKIVISYRSHDDFDRIFAALLHPAGDTNQI